MTKKKMKNGENTITHILLALFAFIQIYPLFWLFEFSLKDNSEITLEDLLGPDYINIANESIKAQIASDSSGLYFDEEMGGFTTITPETNFYINEAGNPIIVFQKYEIAAGAAGMPEFEITK